MTIAMWIIQGFLAVVFLGAGLMKLLNSREELVDNGMEYAEDFSETQIQAIGAVEVLGAVGVILPTALGIAPVLAGAAAVGLTLTMIGAAYTHIRRGEYPMIVVNIVLGGLAAYVAVQVLL
jgi:uncharacterized membrane protein YphA (DoxX/SURF4 family)